VAADEIYTRNIKLLDGRPGRTEVALFFAEADHYLRIDQNYPKGLLECANYFHDVTDYDVVDERLVADGILKNYSILIIPGNPLLEKSTWEQLSTSLGRTKPLRIIQVVENKPVMGLGEFMCIDGTTRTLPSTNSSHRLRRVVGQPSDPNIIRIIQQAHKDLLVKHGLSKEEIDILTLKDDVLTTLFKHRILAYNTANKPRTIAPQTVLPKDILEIKRRR
jgi:hypothetical protein